MSPKEGGISGTLSRPRLDTADKGLDMFHNITQSINQVYVALCVKYLGFPLHRVYTIFRY